jgi:Zn-dependent protease with chaperone function
VDGIFLASREAVFFDGESNRRRLVELRFADSLQLIEAGEPLAAWHYRTIRSLDAPPGMMRLWSTEALPLARLELRNSAAQCKVRELCPALTGPGGTRPISIPRIAGWSLAATVVIVAMIWFGVPVVADQLAAVLPTSWERPLGAAVDGQVRAMFPGAPCLRPDGQVALLKLVATLQSAAQLRIPPNPIVLRSPVPNAFALPGGRIYILSGLLDRARSPDELAGVLAHEFGHVAHRDAIRRLIRNGGTAFLIGLLFGDVSGAGAALFAVRTLLDDAYSREVEAGADGFAITVMHRLGRPTAPLGQLLTRITAPGDNAFSLLRDHPLTPERVRRLAQDDVLPTGPDLLDPEEWAALRRICR